MFQSLINANLNRSNSHSDIVVEAMWYALQRGGVFDGYAPFCMVELINRAAASICTGTPMYLG